MAKKRVTPRAVYTTVCQTCGPPDGVVSVESDSEVDARTLHWLHIVDEPDHMVYVMVGMTGGGA